MTTSVQKALAEIRKVQSCHLSNPIKVDPESCYDFKAKTSVQQALSEKSKAPAFIKHTIQKPNYRAYEDYVNAPTTRITGTTSGTIPVTIAPASSCYGHFPNVSSWSSPVYRSIHYAAGSGGGQEKKMVSNVKKNRSKKKLVAERKRADKESSNILPAGTKRRRLGGRALTFETPTHTTMTKAGNESQRKTPLLTPSQRAELKRLVKGGMPGLQALTAAKIFE